MKIQLFATVIAVAAVTTAVAFADRPTADDKPIVKVVEQLEKQGYGPFSDIDFDDGRWEVEAYKGDVAYELRVDRRTGQILSEHRDDSEPQPPRDSKPLSQILHAVINAGYKDLDDVSFERRYWEIEAFRDGDKREIHVHPTTAEVINDRRDVD